MSWDDAAIRLAKQHGLCRYRIMDEAQRVIGDGYGRARFVVDGVKFAVSWHPRCCPVIHAE